MKEYYELSMNGAYVWIRHTQNDEIYFTKEMCNTTILLEKASDNEYLFIDFITGRTVYIDPLEDGVLLFPSKILVPNKLNKIANDIILQKSLDILNNDELDYLNVSEDILFNSCFCEIVAKENNLDKIPISLEKEEVEKHKEMHRKRTKSE